MHWTAVDWRHLTIGTVLQDSSWESQWECWTAPGGSWQPASHGDGSLGSYSPIEDTGEAEPLIATLQPLGILKGNSEPLVVGELPHLGSDPLKQVEGVHDGDVDVGVDLINTLAMKME